MPFGPFTLQWRPPTPNPPQATSLPQNFQRSSIQTPDGPLELISLIPTDLPTDNLPPLFFAHGGFGCAEIWLSYMQFFAARGYQCYAISYRGHGKSWYPSFWRMYFTTRHSMAQDLAAGIDHVGAIEGRRRSKGDPVRCVLIAHSAGGALSQYALSRGMIKVAGFCMLAAVPGFGSWSCYRFWACTAPIHFPYRAFHPRYILATIPQIHEAFFTKETPCSLVQRFARLLSPYESMLWPMQALFRFVTGPDVLSAITGWGRVKDGSTVSQRLFVLAAEKDVLCTPSILHDAAQRYRSASREMVSRGEWSSSSEIKTRQNQQQVEWPDVVRFCVVEGLGHHLQNHEEWERGAREVLGWLEQL